MQQHLVLMEELLLLHSKLLIIRIRYLCHSLCLQLTEDLFNAFGTCSGDHTVKIIDCQTGSCLKVLSGHRRTPWVVSFPFHEQQESRRALLKSLGCLICIFMRENCVGCLFHIELLWCFYRLGFTRCVQKFLPVGVWIMKFAYGMQTHQSA